MIFFDFEVFKFDWLVVLIDSNERKGQNPFDMNNEEMRQVYQREVNESNARRDGGQRISGLAAKKDMNRKAAIN